MGRFFSDNWSAAFGRLHAAFADDIENNGGLYLFGIKLKNKTIRSYAVERIKAIRPLKCDIVYPQNFDPLRRLNSALDLTHGEPVTLKIRFSQKEGDEIFQTSQNTICGLISNFNRRVNMMLRFVASRAPRGRVD